MATKYAMWVHGTSIQAEREGYFISKSHKGWGAEFTTQGDEWYHFSIPTPVITGGKDTFLEKVFILYETFLGAKVDAIHLYDGANKIKEYNNLNFDGTHKGVLDTKNNWLVNPQVHIKFGLGISVLVKFGSTTAAGVPKILFATAGADFNTP